MAEGGDQPSLKRNPLTLSSDNLSLSSDLFCQPCDTEEKYVVAEGYCFDCKEYLCTECYNSHRKPKPLRNHKLLDKHNMPLYKEQDPDQCTEQDRDPCAGQDPVVDFCTEPCGTHNDRIKECFCKKHNEFCCSLCILLDHKKCTDVIFIPGEAKTLPDSQEYKDTRQKLATMTKTTEKFIKTTKDFGKIANFCHSQAALDFKEFRKDLNQALDKAEEAMTAMTMEIKEEDENKLTLAYENYSKVLETLQTLESEFQRLEGSRQNCQLFITMKDAQKDTLPLVKSLKVEKDEISVRKYKLAIKNQLEQFMKHPVTMGGLDIVKISSDDNKDLPDHVIATQEYLKQKFR